MPQVIVIAGPNRAGKSTAAAGLLPPGLVFLNADEIAKELKAQGTTHADIEAGRRLLTHMTELERQGRDFAVEPTLSNRALARRILRLQEQGYRFTLLFFWLSSDDLAVKRVVSRVQRGGHDIPETTIRRRYKAALSNFFSLYRPTADVWRMYDNSHFGTPRLIAAGRVRIYQRDYWKQLESESKNDTSEE